MSLVPDEKLTVAGTLVRGIDVSHHNNELKWQNLRAAGYEFAFIKSSEGETLGDERFDENREAAHANNILCGPYHFFRPKTAGQGQINNFLRAVGSMRAGELPPVLDLEVPADWKGVKRDELMAEWHSIVPEDRIKRVLQWLNAVEQRLGIRPIIYASPSFVNNTLNNDSRLAPYILWIANYNVDAPTIPAPWTKAAFWQHSEHGKIPTVGDTDFDLNVFYGSLDDLKRMCYGFRATAVETAWYERCWLTRWIARLWRS
jgi:lysozyme